MPGIAAISTVSWSIIFSQKLCDGLEITPLGNDAALVLGQWNLARESEPVRGNFSLVVRRVDDRWLIIHDHTSQATDDK
jgi:hypothetical protein